MLTANKERTSAFWNRDFLVALTGYFFLFMSVTLFFLLPLFLQQFEPSKSRVGLIMGVHSVMAILIRPLFGRRIDIQGGRRISLAGIAFLIITVPLFHLVQDAGWLPILLRACTGFGWGIAMTAAISICSDLAPVERLARSMGIIGIAGLVASAAGPLAAEEIIARFGFGGLFNASFLFLAASFLCILAARDGIRRENDRRPSDFRGLKGIGPIVLIVVAAMPVFHGAVRGAMINFIALFGRSVGVDRIGLFFLLFSAAAILTRFGLSDLSDRFGRKRVIFPAAVIIALNLVFLSQVRGPAAFAAAGFIGGLGQGLIFPALSTYIIDFLGRQNKGLAISLYLSFFDVGMGLGSPFFGWISDISGYRTMYLAAAGLLLLATGVFMRKAPATEGPENPRGGSMPPSAIR